MCCLAPHRPHPACAARDLVQLIEHSLRSARFILGSHWRRPDLLKRLAVPDAVLVPTKLVRLSEALARSKHPQAALWPLMAALHYARGMMPWAEPVPRLCMRAMVALDALSHHLPIEAMDGLPADYKANIKWAADRGLDGAAQLQEGSVAQLAGRCACMKAQARVLMINAVPNTRPMVAVLYERRMAPARRLEEELRSRAEEEEARRRATTEQAPQCEKRKKVPARLARLRRQNRRQSGAARKHTVRETAPFTASQDIEHAIMPSEPAHLSPAC